NEACRFRGANGAGVGCAREDQGEATERQGGEALIRPRRASVVVVLCVLTWTATAHAACSCVVWRKDDHHDWVPLGAGVVHEKCEYAAKVLAYEEAMSAAGRKLGFILPPRPRGPGGAEGEVPDTDARLGHPWLRTNPSCA